MEVNINAIANQLAKAPQLKPLPVHREFGPFIRVKQSEFEPIPIPVKANFFDMGLSKLVDIRV